jgi:heterodisulfide reductase subunit A
VLSNGVVADAANLHLAELLNLSIDQDGFFEEANPKSAPLDSVDRGKYFCGLCHSPIHIDTSIIQGKAAGARAAALLWSGVAEDVENVAEVNTSRCAGCGACVAVCRYDATSLDAITGLATVDAALCRGCGVCAASCRSSAIEVCGYDNEQLLGALAASQ